jgi:hypothetical protein
VRTIPEAFAEHTTEVLRELGYGDGEIADLLAGPCAQADAGIQAAEE